MRDVSIKSSYCLRNNAKQFGFSLLIATLATNLKIEQRLLTGKSVSSIGTCCNTSAMICGACAQTNFAFGTSKSNASS